MPKKQAFIDKSGVKFVENFQKNQKIKKFPSRTEIRYLTAFMQKSQIELPVLNYFIVFATGFIAATLLPAQSEAVLLGMLHLSQQSAMLLVLFATVGNVLGSVLNWWLGTQLERFKERSWFPVSEQRLVQAQDYYQRYGSWILLFSWLPIIGDPITFVAGVLRERFYRFLILVSLAKGGRYVLISLAYVYAQA